jgi:hypothetical protein
MPPILPRCATRIDHQPHIPAREWVSSPELLLIPTSTAPLAE